MLASDTIVLRDGAAVTRTAIAELDLGKGKISRDDFVGTLIVHALIGGLVGYAFGPTEWERIPLPAAAR